MSEVRPYTTKHILRCHCRLYWHSTLKKTPFHGSWNWMIRCLIYQYSACYSISFHAGALFSTGFQENIVEESLIQNHLESFFHWSNRKVNYRALITVWLKFLIQIWILRSNAKCVLGYLWVQSEYSGNSKWAFRWVRSRKKNSFMRKKIKTYYFKQGLLWWKFCVAQNKGPWTFPCYSAKSVAC